MAIRLWQSFQDANVEYVILLIVRTGAKQILEDEDAHHDIIANHKSSIVFHSRPSAIGLIASVIFLLANGEVFLLRLGAGGGALRATMGIDCSTKGGCFVCSHEISGSTYVRTFVSMQRSSRLRSMRSSSEM